MAAGGSKDCVCIANLFSTRVIECDPDRALTDVFFFDGAGNMQKGGEMLMAMCPRAHCLHGGEHVTSLFFSDISEHPAIKVRLKQGLCLTTLISV